ncbi:MAG: phosphopantothenoylcysteine decarboxylase, partial [Desulfosalsimonas sp.]
GPTGLDAPAGVRRVRVSSAEEMAGAVFAEADDADVIIKAAAVSDYRPVKTWQHKVKKDEDSLALELARTTDILAGLGRRKKPGQILAGFAAETRDLKKNAVSKLESKNLDLIAANLVGGDDSGFEADTNRISLFYRDGTSEELPLMDKDAAAHILLDRIAALQV